MSLTLSRTKPFAKTSRFEIVQLVSICFLKNKAIPHRLDVGFAPSFSPIKGEPPYSLNHTSLLHLRLFVVLPNCFGYLLFASIF